MAITTATRLRHTHGAIFYGVSGPVQPHNPSATPGAGSLWIVTPVVAVTAGAPGAFIPASAKLQDLAEMNANGTLGQLAPWNPGEYVELGDGSEAYWDGATWQQGRAPLPLATIATPGPVVAGQPGTPGTFGPAVTHRVPTTFQELSTINGGTTPWVSDQHVNVGGSDYYWDWNNAWVPGRAPAVLVTGATAGAPGSWTPAMPTHQPPTTTAQLNMVNGGAAWTKVGDYITMGTDQYHWDGTAWQLGPVVAPLVTGVTPGAPGSFTPAAGRVPATLQELQTINGGAAWTTVGNYVRVGGVDYYWNGTTWTAGRVPQAAMPSGFTLGAPSTLQPPGAYVPTWNDLTLGIQFNQFLGVTYGWPAGTYLTTGDGLQVYWNGTAWVRGPSQGATSVDRSVLPYRFNPVNVASIPKSVAELNYWLAYGELVGQQVGQPWPQGANAVLADNVTRVHWNGTKWAAGASAGTGILPPDSVITAPVKSTSATWSGNVTPASATEFADAAEIRTDSAGTLYVAWNEIATPTLYLQGSTEIQVLNAAGDAIIWSTRNTAGNRINGVPITGYTAGVNRLRLVFRYSGGRPDHVVEIQP